MNIRNRLHISNIVMIVVPVLAAVVAGVVCAIVLWIVITGGAPFGTDALEAYFGFTDLTDQAERRFKALAALAVVVLLTVVVVTVVLTDRFMTRFVIRHITDPLDELSEGVAQIRSGNLAYRIGYDGQDEFAPVCDAFDEMAQRLADSVERDQRDEEKRRELFVGMSHDLRSPLTSIRGYAEGLRDGVAVDEETRQRYVGVILDKTSDIERKVSHLLTMTRLDGKEGNVEVHPLALDAYVRAFIRREQEELAVQGMQVTCRLEAAIVDAAPAELDRILENLLDNSLKYRKGDSVAVEVTVVDGDGGATLSLADDGKGVPDEDLARIFDPLYRGDAARSGTREGSGLGLSIVAASAARMGGSVSAVRSEAGGLCVRVMFPHAKGEEARGA